MKVAKNIIFIVLLFSCNFAFPATSLLQNILESSTESIQTLLSPDITTSSMIGAVSEPLIEIDRKSSYEFEIVRRVLKIINCTDKPRVKRMNVRGPYWVLYNFVIPDTTYLCHESITLTTQADFTFLDNLEPLVEHWRGPISIAMYAPGDDFHATLNSIAYLRHCRSKLIKRYVAFHLFFDNSHIPTKVDDRIMDDKYIDYYNCTNAYPPYLIPSDSSYRHRNNLTYPINVGRNIAREEGLTYFVLSSDVELRPSLRFISRFMQMVANNPKYVQGNIPKIYVLPVFEVLKNEKVPNYKKELIKMLKEKKAFIFHEKLCRICHAIPQFSEWTEIKESDELNIFITTKRQGSQRIWEAFYVGTHEDPVFDERLVWEGQSNKMTQGYALCLLNYDYMVLDNAFFVHKPGVKKDKIQVEKYSKIIGETDYFLRHYAKQELDNIYGKRNGCYLYL